MKTILGNLPFSIKALVAELMATAIFVYIGTGMGARSRPVLLGKSV